jgi:hypothetical protein
MKKIVLIFSCCFLINTAFSQILFTEDFNFPSGAVNDSIGGGVGTTTALGDTIWKKHSGAGTNGRAVKYTTTSLSYSGYYGSGIGGAARFQHTVGSADINGSLGTSINSGTVYTAFMLKVDSTGGNDSTCDYFFHYCDLYGATNLTNFRAKLFICAGSDSSTKFKIGISKGLNAKPTAAQLTAGGSKPTFSTTEYNIGQTYLVIVKYTFNTTSGDDVTNLFVLSGAIPAVEPTPDATSIDATSAASDLSRIQSICIRQGSIGRTAATIDGIRVFTTWDAATVTALPAKLNSFSAIGLNNLVNVNWTALCTVNSCNFFVERGIDGLNFETVSSLNSSANSNYTISDKNLPTAKILYYRLKIVNNDGKIEYSTIQKVQVRNIKLSISPNPTSNEILVNANSSISLVELFDITGKCFYSNKNANTNSIKIPVVNLVAGTYFVKTTIDGEMSSNKILVKH